MLFDRVHIARHASAKLKRFAFVLSCVVAFVVWQMNVAAQELVNLKNGVVVSFRPNSTVQINGSININSGATLNQNGQLTITGNIVNNGSMPLNSGTFTFSGSADALVSGTAANNYFGSIIVSKNGATAEVRINSSNFDAPNDFLTLTQGVFRISGSFVFSRVFFSTANYTINPNSGLWVDNPQVTVLGANGTITLEGLLRLTNGTINVGTAAGNDLIYTSTAAQAPRIEISNGNLNVAGRLSRSANAADSVQYSQSGGKATVGTSGSPSVDRGVFDISQTTSTFNWTGGDIELNSGTGYTNGDFHVLAGSGTVSGNGSLRINATLPAQIVYINTNKTIPSLVELAANSPQVVLTGNDLSVSNEINLAGAGADRFLQNTQDITLYGNWTNNFSSTAGFNGSSRTVTFAGGSAQYVRGGQETYFNNVTLNKTDNAPSDTTHHVYMDTAMRINGELRIVSNTLLDLQFDTLTIGPAGNCYSSPIGFDQAFTNKKFVLNSMSGFAGGKIRKMMTPDVTPPIPEVNFLFPAGSYVWDAMNIPYPSYTPAVIKIYKDSADYGPNASVSLKLVPREHPQVETPGVSFKKYWVVKTEDIVFKPIRTSDFMAYFDPLSIQGSIVDYYVWAYRPSYPDPDGFWQMNPGRDNNYVRFGENFFYSTQLDSLSGDFVGGEQSIGRATYYSIKNGDYNDPNTWSKLGFEYTGNPSNTAPNKRSDRVMIRDTVTISAPIAKANIVWVDKGVVNTVTKTGRLRILGSNIIQGDTMRVGSNVAAENAGILDIGHPNGIILASTKLDSGAVQTNVRDFSQNGIYRFIDSTAALQTTGDAVPSPVRSIAIEGGSISDTVALSKTLIISDSLVINQGALDIGLNNTIDGALAGRTMTMRGGEMIIRNSFPLNYTPPVFTIGRITFEVPANPTIPSTMLQPQVGQYYDLKISGNVSGSVAFQSQGEIRISNNFDLSRLNFVGAPNRRFNTNGSTVVFNGNNQDIPCRPQSPSDTVVNLSYYNLRVENSGTKRLRSSDASTFIVLNDLTITNGAALALNSQNLEVQHSWLNATAGSTFVPGTNSVIFRSIINDPLAPVTVTVRDTAQNPFHHVVITGIGYTNPSDNWKVRGNFTIESGSKYVMGSTTPTIMSLEGNWTNLGGTFTAGKSTVRFDGSATQFLSKVSGNALFYNLVVNNPNSVNANSVGTLVGDNGVYIDSLGSITLQNGNLITRSRYLSVHPSATLIRTGATAGHIDGAMRRYIGTGTVPTVFEVGYGKSYTPYTISFNADGGKAGYINIIADTITPPPTATSPVSWNNSTPTQILPSGSGMSLPKHVARQWSFSVPSSSSFAIGAGRTYNAITQFIKTNDLRNGANYSVFESRLLTPTGLWVSPIYTFRPNIGFRADTAIEYRKLDSIGTIIIGDPANISFFSIANGNWSVPSNWSTQGYGGTPSLIAPADAATGDSAHVYVGDSKTITLDGAYSCRTSGFVQIDTSGKLLTGTNIISGTGAFRIAKDGALALGSANGTNATGNIQTTTVDLNYGNHGRSHLIFNGALTPQAMGTRVPATIASLTIDKAAQANVVNLNQAVAVSDSLHIVVGNFTAGANLTINGNLRRESGSLFTPGAFTLTFSGVQEDTITNLGALPLVVNNLTLNKTDGTGNVLLWDNTVLQIGGTLDFTATATNKSTINARTRTGAYVISTSGTVNNASNTRGWVNGELRKNVAINQSTTIWEVGDFVRYSPFQLAFNSNGGTAGYVGLKVEDGRHPYLLVEEFHSIYPFRLIGPKYWRMTRPQGSTFAQGGRTFSPRAYFVVPGDEGAVDYWGCIEMSYLRKWTGGIDWQPMYAANGASNDGATFCTDTRDLSKSPRFTYTGALAGGLAYCNAATVNTLFGSSEMIGNDLLLGDFICGQQDSLKQFYSFYSVRDGNWSDPTTWSTVGYGSTVNYADSTYRLFNGNTVIRGTPRRQYDNAYIGDGHKVTLDCNVGTNWTVSDDAVNALTGPSTYVEAGGTLDLGYYNYHGNAFVVEKFGTLIIGSADGILPGNKSTTGNVSMLFVDAAYNDSCNVIYSAAGNTHNTGYRYTLPTTPDNRTNYITRVQATTSPGGVSIFDNQTDDRLRRSNTGINHYLENKVTLVAGSTYNLTVTANNNGVNRYFKAWIDYDRNCGFTNAAPERLFSNRQVGQSYTGTFTVPAGTTVGSTRLRVSVSTNDCDQSSNSNGEYEDYTVEIINNNNVITQATGTGLPNTVMSFGVNSMRNNGSIINLGKAINVIDSVYLKSGELRVGANAINLYGDFVHDSINAFNAGTGTVNLLGNQRDTIRGSAPVAFNNLTVNKSSADTVIVFKNQKVTVNGTFNYSTNNNVHISDGDSLVLGASSTLTGTFGKTRMFVSSGGANGAYVSRLFTNAAGAKSFTFPVGVDTIYNPAFISMTGTYAATPSIGLRLHSGLHPNRISDNILKKYWSVDYAGISSVTASSLQFTYHTDDINGNYNKYVPACYITGTGWEINLGTTPIAKPSPITLTNSNILAGDFTAGESPTFFKGRIFWSRATGNWNLPSNWSNDPVLRHAGPPSSYYPSQLFLNDTVYIDGHTITYNLDSARVDTINLGSTNPAVGVGTLTMGPSPLIKWLKTSAISISENSILNGSNTPGRYDTLYLPGNLSNTSTGGVNTYAAANAFTTIAFVDSLNSQIVGEGAWGDIGKIILAKNRLLSDSLINNSLSFSAATTTSNSGFQIVPQTGVFVHNVNATVNVSRANTLQMGKHSGFTSNVGLILSGSDIITDFNSVIELKGGNFTIGDAPGEGLYYNTGSYIKANNGYLDIAGSLSRYQTASTVNFSMDTNGTTRVLRLGSTDSTKIGFDLGNVGSSFDMPGGRIIIAKGVLGAIADFYVSATNGSGMTGGIIQAGDSTIAANNPIKLKGTMPVYMLHSANAVGSPASTTFNEMEFTVRNNYYVDANHSVSFLGNSLALGGDLINYGTFNSTNGRLTLNGNANTQTIFNQTGSGLTLFNFTVQKTNGGLVALGTGNSNLVVRNIFEFGIGNTALFNSRTNNKYLEISPSGGSSAALLQNGGGHIDGRLYRYVDVGASSVFFPVGGSTAVSSYRPVLFESVGSGGSAGLVGAIHYDFNHPEFPGDSLVRNDNSIQKYWNVNTGTGFDLGGRTYNLTTYYILPSDTIGRNPTLSFLEHFRRTPGYDTVGNWFTTTTTVKTDSTIKSITHRFFGDFIIGEPSGVTFYSYQSGNWMDYDTWSLSGYNIYDPPTRAPGFLPSATDKVYIGNGKRVTVPTGVPFIEVRAITVEKPAGMEAGELYVDGELNLIRGIAFELKDSCIMGMQRFDGLSLEGTPSGVIQTTTRKYGVSKYVYYNTKSQAIGLGLPDSVASIIVDNTGLNTFTVTFNKTAAAVKIRDSIQVLHGRLASGDRSLILYGNFSLWNNTAFEPGAAGIFTMSGTKDSRLYLGNAAGLAFNVLQMNKENGAVVEGLRLNGALNNQIYINKSLNFLRDDNYFVLGDSLDMIVYDTRTDSAIINYGNSRFVRTSKTSGMLYRNVLSSGSYVFPVGSLEGGTNRLARAVFAGGGAGTNGLLAVRTSEGSHAAPYDGTHIGISSTPGISYLRRYWAVDTSTAKINGGWTFHFPADEVVGADFGRVGRWRPFKEKLGGFWMTYPVGGGWSINMGGLSFSTPSDLAYANFYGDWIIGSDQAFRRIFFSRQSGNWDDPNTWTYAPHPHASLQPIFGPGIWPDNTQDSVIIGGGNDDLGNHVVSLDLSPNVSGVSLGTDVTNTGTLFTGNYTLFGNVFNIGDHSTLGIGSSDGIALSGESTGNIQTTTRGFNPNAIYYYNGTTDQKYGSGLPANLYTLVVNNTGAAGSNAVRADKNVTVDNNLIVLSGVLSLGTNTANGSASNTGKFTLADGAYIRVGGANAAIDVVNLFTGYSLGEDSWFEYVGDNQDISNVPLLMYDASSSVGEGYGNLLLNGFGSRFVTKKILARGNMHNEIGSTLAIPEGLDALTVYKNVYNKHLIINSGVIDIGQ